MASSFVLSDRAESIARDLLRIGAVTLRPAEPFSWSSGRLAPIYTDNRLTLAHPEVRRRIAEAFAEIVRGLPAQPDAVAGTATAGIPHAAFLADRLDLPMAYVRGAAKGHGQRNRIEGRVRAGQHLVLVEDLISTGGSVLSAAAALRQAGASVEALLAIFTYNLPAANLSGAQCPLYVLTDYTTLVEAATSEGAIDTADLDTLRAWREDPSVWSRTRGGAA